jgi:hypothetical protein
VGDPAVSSDISRKRTPGYQPQARRANHSPPAESETASGSEVPPSEGNEARREGHQEVVVLHSTAESGEARTLARAGRGKGVTK